MNIGAIARTARDTLCRGGRVLAKTSSQDIGTAAFIENITRNAWLHRDAKKCIAMQNALKVVQIAAYD
ncbi:hypothetical protein ACI2KC_07195 [Pseudomonas monteilii]